MLFCLLVIDVGLKLSQGPEEMSYRAMAAMSCSDRLSTNTSPDKESFTLADAIEC
jgi:hypothetical protein